MGSMKLRDANPVRSTGIGKATYSLLDLASDSVLEAPAGPFCAAGEGVIAERMLVSSPLWLQGDSASPWHRGYRGRSEVASPRPAACRGVSYRARERIPQRREKEERCSLGEILSLPAMTLGPSDVQSSRSIWSWRAVYAASQAWKQIRSFPSGPTTIESWPMKPFPVLKDTSAFSHVYILIGTKNVVRYRAPDAVMR